MGKTLGQKHKEIRLRRKKNKVARKSRRINRLKRAHKY